MLRFSLRAHTALVLFLLAFSWLAFRESTPTRAQDPFGADPFGGAADPFDGGGDPLAKPPAAPEKKEVRAPRRPLPKRRPATEADVLAALDKPVEVDFVKIPLADAAAFLGDFAKINVDLDRRALDDVGIRPDIPVTRTVNGISLRSALRLILRELDLTYVIDGGTLVITTPEEADRADGPGFGTEVYPVGHLLASADALVDFGERADDGDLLVYLITAAIRPTTWEDVGGPGSVDLLRDKLIVSNTHEVHEEVKDLLDTLDTARQIVAAGGTPKVTSLPQVRASDAEKKIEAELAKPTVIEFIETPLGDVVKFLADRHKINIQINDRALEDVGLGRDTPVTRSIKGVSLAAALRLTLKEMDLTYLIRDEVLLITTPEECECALSTRVFPVHDLVFPRDDDFLASEFPGADYDSLIDLITSTVRPTTWEEVGGPGAIEPFGGCLVFSQTGEVLKETEELLIGIRKLKAQYDARPKDPPTRPIYLDEISAPSLQKLRAALDREVGMIAFRKSPLADVVKALAEKHDLPIQIDHRALADTGIGSDAPLTATLGGESLGAALRRMLRELDLVWVIRDEVILITSKEEAQSELHTRIYPVRDLVVLKDSSVDVDGLIDTLTRTVRVTTWEDFGGPGAVEHYGPCFGLVVSQTEDVHEEIALLLAKIRTVEEKKHAEEDEVEEDEAEAGEEAKPQAADGVRKDKTGKLVYLKVYRLSHRDREDAGELADAISDLVAPQSWKSDEAYYLKPLAGAIIVRHTAEAHRKIHRLLTELDALAWPNFGGGGGAFGTPPTGGGMGGGGIFSVPDEIRAQFGCWDAQGASIACGLQYNSPSSISIVSTLSLPQRGETKVMPLVIYNLSNVDRKDEGAEIAEAIRELIAVGEWDVATGAYLRSVQRKLIVRHRADVQRRVGRLLLALGAIERPVPNTGGLQSVIPVVGEK